MVEAEKLVCEGKKCRAGGCVGQFQGGAELDGVFANEFGLLLVVHIWSGLGCCSCEERHLPSTERDVVLVTRALDTIKFALDTCLEK